MSANGASRYIIRLALLGDVLPLMGNTLLAEYEDVMTRDHITARCVLNESEREELLNAFLNTCEWMNVYFLWRPNLRDEQDNHLIELALAGGAGTIVTNNIRDFNNIELTFPDLDVLNAGDFLEHRRLTWEH